MRLRSVLRFGVAAVLAAAGGVAATWPAAPARADVPPIYPANTKGVAVALELDWGVLADRVSRPYEVVKGDTLSSIAARLCGGKDRWKAIADANPGVVRPPDQIDAGATLWLPPPRSFDPPPPATAPGNPKALAPWYDAFWMRNFARWREGPRDRAGPTDKPGAPASWSLLLVAHSETAALLAAIRSGDVELDHPAVANAWVLRMGVDSLAHADDPTVRIVARHRITGLDGKTVTADLNAVRYDAKGQVVAKRMLLEGEEPAPAPKEPEPAPKDPAPDDDRAVHRDIPAPADSGFRWPTTAGILVALAGAVVVALLVLRRRPPPEAVTRDGGPGGRALPSAAVVATYAAGAALLASAAPLLAYAGSLALLGAPHALAELRYVDGRFSRRLGRARGAVIAAILVVVVLLRAAVLAGRLRAADVIPLELGLVAVLAFTVVPDLAARPLRALVAVGVGAALALGSFVDPLTVVVVLAVLHNATPIGLLAERDDVRPRLLVPALVLFVAVPAAIATGVPSQLLAGIGAAAPDVAFASAGALHDHLRVFVPPALLGSSAATALFSACAYLQLLHYGVVLGVLPRLTRRDAADASRVNDQPVLPWPRARVLAAAIAVVGAGFAAAFVADFVPARAAYGLLAAVHAWIEVPVLLLALAPRATGDHGDRRDRGGRVTQTGAFLATLVIEVPIVVALVAFAREPRPALSRIALLAVGANAFTHPLLWIADSALASDVARPLRWTVLELAVVAVEGAAYAFVGRLGRRRALALSFVANAASFAAGLAWAAVAG